MPRLFIQPDDPFTLLEGFSLLPIVVQPAIQRPPIQANNFELKTVDSNLANASEHMVPRTAK